MKIRVETSQTLVREAHTGAISGVRRRVGTELIHRVHFQINDREFFGVGALLHGSDPATPPAAFDKILSAARDLAETLRADSPFSFWMQLHHGLTRANAKLGLPFAWVSLIASLYERALLDAVACRAGLPLSRLVLDQRENPLGIECSALHPALKGRPVRDFLPARSYQSLATRIAISANQTPAQIQAVVGELNPNQIQLEVGRRPEADLAWMVETLRALGGRLSPQTGFVLAFNGAFQRPTDFFHFWADLRSHPALEPILRRLVALVQPFPDADALGEKTSQFFKGWPPRVPVLVDTSNLQPDSLRLALACGYNGAVHTPNAGFFKALADAALISLQSDEDRLRQWRYIGGPLGTASPLACCQDALIEALLGLDAVTIPSDRIDRSLDISLEDIRNTGLSLLNELYSVRDGAALLTTDAGRLRLQRIGESPFGPGQTVSEMHFGAPILLKA